MQGATRYPFGSGNGRLVTVFGGSGFVGRHVVRALARDGWRVRVAVRRPDLAGFLRPYGMVGQVEPVQANLRFPRSLPPVLAGAEAVVNCVGIRAETRRQSFAAVHVDGARAVAEAARAAGAAALVHLSALGADAGSDARYLASKAEGEAAVAAAFPEAAILRPSLQFGPEDTLFNRLAAMARFTPALPLVAGGVLHQPVFVGDVGAAVARLLAREAMPAGPFELGGPEVRSFRDLMATMLATIERRRLLLPLPHALALPLGGVLGLLPGRLKLLTADLTRQLRHPTVVSPAAAAEGRTLQGLGIAPTSLAAILPTYLSQYRARGEFERQRG